ncbi:MAG: hypothetical protein AAFX86_11265 [Pseudomonadota bacterium]
MNIATKIALSALALVTAATGTAAAQDYMDWSSMSSGGLEMVDQWGYVHTVDPWAHDSQVDFYGNVVSSYGYEMDPMIGYSALTPAWQDNSFSVYNPDPTGFLNSSPYESPSNSHESFINMIHE